MTVEEKVAMTKVAETITFENGRYTVGIPWREGELRLGNNYDAALGRLQNQEKSLKPKGPDIMKQYSHIFEEYEHKGYIKKVAKSETKEQWFLPHFPVIRPDKDTTKVRVVFDAAMKCQGKSLNDAIQSGPKMQREILDVLIRFRRAPVALIANISEMFLQVGLQTVHTIGSCGEILMPQKSPTFTSFNDCYLGTLHHHSARSMSFIFMHKPTE